MAFMGKTWKYINEGNAHIVIRDEDSRYVLRLIKEHGTEVEISQIRQAVKFVNFVMMPLLTRDCWGHMEVLEIPRKELLQLIRELSEVRPRERRLKAFISHFAIKAPNLTIINPSNVNYCIEIKPKEGFMSKRFQQYGKCYYCLKQYLKMQEKQISLHSGYCPLDLFSGDRKRMKEALINLISNPQNNFKLFKNGEIIFSDKLNCNFEDLIRDMNVFSSLNLFLDFIIEILLFDNRALRSKLIESDMVTVKRKDNCIDNCNLNSNMFLYNILQLQKMTDSLNHTIDADEINIEYVSEILNIIETNKLNLATNEDQIKLKNLINPRYLALISAIVKDCSIMISFSPTFEEGNKYILVKNEKISFRSNVTDLEPKLPKTLSKRLITENKLIEIYERHLNEKKVCYDPTALGNQK